MNRANAFLLTCVLCLGAGVSAADELLRNAGFEQGAEAWSLPKPVYEVTSTQARSGGRCLHYANDNASRYMLATQKVACRAGQCYEFSVWVKTKDVKGTDTGATICIEYYGESGYIGGSYPAGVKGTADWTKVNGRSGPIPKEATSVHIVLYVRKSMTGEAWFDDVELEEYFPPPLEAAMVWPNYRGWVLPGSTAREAVILTKLAESLKPPLTPDGLFLRAEVFASEKPEGEPVSVVDAASTTGRVWAPLDKLKPGPYCIRLRLVGRSGSKLIEEQVFRGKVFAEDEPLPRVYIDRHNRTIVDGKPFFPIGLYWSGISDEKGVEDMKTAAAGGFNCIMSYGLLGSQVTSGKNREEGVRQVLDAADGLGMKIIFTLKDIYEGTRWYRGSWDDYKGEKEVVPVLVKTFRSHPAVLGWYLNDELPLKMRDRLEARYDLVRELDPDHPTWAVLYQVRELEGYRATCDILGVDPYPIGDAVGRHGPVGRAFDWVDTAKEATAGFGCVWSVPQVFDWACYRKDEEQRKRLRPPTREEMRAMTWLHVIAGANGIINYSFFDLKRDRAGFENRWKDVVPVMGELARAVPTLLEATEPAVQVKGPGRDSAVKWRARQAPDGAILLMAANAELSPQYARFLVPKGLRLEKFAGVDPLVYDAGCLSIQLPIHGVGVYKLSR